MLLRFDSAMRKANSLSSVAITSGVETMRHHLVSSSSSSRLIIGVMTCDLSVESQITGLYLVAYVSVRVYMSPYYTHTVKQSILIITVRLGILIDRKQVINVNKLGPKLFLFQQKCAFRG